MNEVFATVPPAGAMDELLSAARHAQANAHAPYSKFHVGAAVRTAAGRIHTGANVENASYPEGICAETAALAAMVAAGEREVAEVLVVADGEALITPCGGCRQRLAEFAGPQVPIQLAGPEGVRRTMTLGDLLPLSFSLQAGAGSARSPVDVIRTRAPGFQAKLGLILGSGLGALAGAIEDAVAIPYSDLPGFPQPTVAGHGGRLVLGRLEGMPVACLQGRVHLYEGIEATAVNVPIRTLKALGCDTLILTNAAGSLNPDMAPGSLALVADHINLTGRNPLVGQNVDALGVRFPDMSEVYDPSLRQIAHRAAQALGLPLPEGVYIGVLGPSFETPAEIRAFRTLGADLVGMSTVLEAISARHAGLRILGLSVVTNLAAGLSEGPLGHQETLDQAARAGQDLARLLRTLIREMAA